LPTPVSALLHAAKLVTAGIYLWASVRILSELLLKLFYYLINNSMKWVKDYNTYLIIVRWEGPEHVLKGTMKSLVDDKLFYLDQEMFRSHRICKDEVELPNFKLFWV